MYSEQNPASALLVSLTQVGPTDNLHVPPLRVMTTDWTAPITTRLLIRAARSISSTSGAFPRRKPTVPDWISRAIDGMNVQDAHRRLSQTPRSHVPLPRLRAYVTGAHASSSGSSMRGDGRLQRVFHPAAALSAHNGVPNQVIMQVRRTMTSGRSTPSGRVHPGSLDVQSLTSTWACAMTQGQPLPGADHRRPTNPYACRRSSLSRSRSPDGAAGVARHHAEDGRTTTCPEAGRPPSR